VVAGARARGLDHVAATDFQAIAGQGVTATVEGRKAVLGSAGYLQSQGIETRGLDARADALRAEGQTVVFWPWTAPSRASSARPTR
jgi:Cu+-exporting ATPase